MKKIMVKIKKIPWLLGEYSFLTLLFLISIALAFSGFIFYKYIFLAEKKFVEFPKETFQFEENVYQEVLKEWQKKEERFTRVDKKEYLNLFQERKQPKLEVEQESTESSPETFIYIVKEGETLWGLAERFLGSGLRWREIKSEATGRVFTENSAEVLPVNLRLVIPSK